MAMSTTVARVKVDLRVSHSQLDGDISDMIDACLRDLEIVGVPAVETDTAILNAVKLWCRAHYTDEPDKASAYMARYDAMKATLMMAGEYGGAGRG